MNIQINLDTPVHYDLTNSNPGVPAVLIQKTTTLGKLGLQPENGAFEDHMAGVEDEIADIMADMNLTREEKMKRSRTLMDQYNEKVAAAKGLGNNRGVDDIAEAVLKDLQVNHGFSATLNRNSPSIQKKDLIVTLVKPNNGEAFYRVSGTPQWG